MRPRTKRSKQQKDKRRGHGNLKVDVLREKAIAPHPSSSLVAAVIPPSQGAIRAAIESQVCPWCGSGPFQMLPVHTNKIHGIDKWELRDLAGLSSTEPLCPEDVRAKMREAAIRNDSVSNMTGRTRGASKRTTIAGRARNIAALKTWEVANPQASQSARSKAGRAGAAKRWSDRRNDPS